jgi:hypothetical protein
MTLYISTGNGDWLEVIDSKLIIHVLDTKDLNDEQLAEIKAEWGGFENDKFEQVIEEYGHAKEIQI